MKTNDTTSTAALSAPIPLRPLGHVRSLIEAIGLEVSYVYDDLVFVEHNAFLLQFSATRGEELALWFNSDCLPQERPQIRQRLNATATGMGLQIIDHGSFTLSAVETDQSLQLSFRPLATTDHPPEH